MWATVDLGSAQCISQAVIYQQNEYANSKREADCFKLYASADNSTWVTILDDKLGQSNGEEPNPGWSFKIPESHSSLSYGCNYRYWKIELNGFPVSDGYGGIMALELYRFEDSNRHLVSADIATRSIQSEITNTSYLNVGRDYGGIGV